MPKISEQELARLVKEAEWKGQIIVTLTTIADQAVIARVTAEKLNTEVDTACKKLEGLTAKIDGLESQIQDRKMANKDKTIVYGSLITAISAIVIAALQYLS